MARTTSWTSWSLLWLAVCSSTFDVVRTQKTGAPAGDFDSWVLALEWQPAWNSEDCHEASKKQVVGHTVNHSYAATHLSLHGIWPQYSGDRVKEGYPQFCQGPLGNFTPCATDLGSAVCAPNRSAVQQFNTSELWQKFALEYAWNELALHEWAKHGSCSGWNDAEYFQAQAEAYQRVELLNETAILNGHIGKNVSFQMLTSGFTTKAFFRCDKCVLQGVWLMMSADEATKKPKEFIDIHSVERETCTSCDEILVQPAVPCPSPGPSPSTCSKDHHGPSCNYDKKTAGTSADPCTKVSGCVRCAHSGFCTDVPKPQVFDIVV